MSLADRYQQNAGDLEVSDIGVLLAKYAVLTVFFAIIFLPYLYALLMVFTPSENMFQLRGVTWVPENPTLESWIFGFEKLGVTLLNSILISTGTAVLTLMIGIPGAYVFARKRFRGRKLVFYAVVLSLLFPGLVLIPVLADIWLKTGLFNTVYGLWIANIPNAAFVVWILRDFFEKLPSNIEEAAQVYGCSQFSAFVRVIVPLSMPAVVAIGFLVFLGAWNDYLLANMLTSGRGPRPAAVQLFLDVFNIEGGANWPLLLAETFIIGIPPVVLYMLARKQISETFALGAG